MDLLVGYLVGYIIVFLISVFIIRAIFQIPTIVEYQKKQYMILRQIAHKLGVEEDKIQDIDRPH